MTEISAKAPPVIPVDDVEYPQSPICVTDWVHGYEQPFAGGLLRILQTELRSDRGRAQTKAHFSGSFADRLVVGEATKSKLPYRYDR